MLSSKSALPRETRGYVPTFFATLMIVSEPEAHGFQLCEPVEQVAHRRRRRLGRSPGTAAGLGLAAGADGRVRQAAETGADLGVDLGIRKGLGRA